MRKALSRVYGYVIAARNLCYDTGLFTIHRTGIPVVSIGNIEAGGTGKTPMTIALARELSSRGLKPAIVTRGYRGRLKGVVLVRPDHQACEVGDEALLMARILRVPVIKAPDRVRGAIFARDELSSDLVLLDDGFQHRRIHRDLDIVLVAGDVGSDALLPLGRLREPAASLARADLVVHTKGAGSSEMSAELVPCSLIGPSGAEEDLTSLSGRHVLAVSGIARPGHFAGMLKDLGARVDVLAFPDHHGFTRRDMETISARSQGKDLIVTTEKDLVRLDPSQIKGTWRALRIEMRVKCMETIVREIESIVRKSGISRQG
ncbi:MAG: tetraacyldisaccharide 4'-kinase [Pseudomonadota bacterium]|jgi:tetraacyldisaccharide 4'-kinase|uniref:tetraacyldisaccharide 4'-kinase n=1 Tax=anaerobic digester metagenome TaxID=1263854 RepID=A0A485M5A5_9ZZZZ|nr:tetraacyldisaccharide 4'-kinase [Pseudomonadota bacterium]HON38419.1 tetraacyldisaccharide 4'-kinase [Deltaproteobacteria bacterium]